MNNETTRSSRRSELAELSRFPPDRMRAAFRVLNKFMVAMFRLGLGPCVGGNPYTGYIMVITTIGRRSGLPRRTPVNYASGENEVYCLAGFGRRADWDRNRIAHTHR